MTNTLADVSARNAGRERVRRAYACQFEVRAVAGKPNIMKLRGYASVYESPYAMWDMFGEYEELVALAAGAKTLSESPATQLLLNHAGLSMAYTRAGTLQLSEDSTGLAIEADVNTKRNDVRDMVTAIEDGNIDEMSFAFEIMRQTWSPDYTQRRITEYNIDRGDVSVVNFGANPATSIEASMRAFSLDRLDDTTARTLYERLGARFTIEPTQAPEPVENDDAQRTPGNDGALSLSLARAKLALLDM